MEFHGIEIWPKGKAPSMVSPHFFRRQPDLTFCEGLRNNITLDFRENPVLLQTHIQRPGCFHYTLSGMHGLCYRSPRITLSSPTPPSRNGRNLTCRALATTLQCVLCFPPLLYGNYGGKWSQNCFKGPDKKNLTSLWFFFPRQGYFVGMAFCSKAEA